MFSPAVGQLYDPRKPGLPEGMSWTLSVRGVQLLLPFPRPTQIEIDAVHGQTGPARFALIERPHVLLLCFRFGDGLRWASQPWQARRQETSSPPGLPEGHGRLAVHVYLVDSVSGVVRAHSAVTWPPSFVAALRAAIGRHLTARHLTGSRDGTAAGAELYELYQRWPGTAELVRERADATCRVDVQ